MIESVDQLESRLRSEYNVKFFVDLAEISTSPTRLFKLLNQHHQESYAPNDRLVFYTSHLPTEQLLQHLYDATNFLDISNFFVLICGPSELESMLSESCQKFSQDPIPFQFLSTELSDTQQFENNFSIPDSVCAIPWINLEIRADGDITPCCMSTLKIGNIDNISLEQAFHSEPIKKLRSSMLAGERPAACDACWKVEKKNLTSIRMHNAKRLKKDFLIRHLEQPTITTVDIKFNNTCNFKCRICSSSSSSLFAQEEHKFLGRPLIQQSNWGESENFINQMISHLPNISNIDMFGGEPFLIKKFKQVLKIAVEQGHSKNIRLHYNSNGSIWPDHFLDYWPNFKLVDIHFSIDAVGHQFELQRGGNWNEVENNILRLRDTKLPNLSISIMPTISAMSVYYIDQVYDWANKHGFPIFVSHARGPGFELQHLTQKAKEIIIQKFKDHPWDEIQKIIHILKSLPDSDGKEFQSRIQWFDQVRKENFAKSHPEIADAMGYVYNKDL